MVEDLLGVGRAAGIAGGLVGIQIEVHVGFAEGHVVGVGKAIVDELPAEAVGHVDHGIVEARVAGGLGGGEEAVVECGVGPEAVERGLGAGEFPGGDLFGSGADGGVGAGVVWGVADCGLFEIGRGVGGRGRTRRGGCLRGLRTDRSEWNGGCEGGKEEQRRDCGSSMRKRER